VGVGAFAVVEEVAGVVHIEVAVVVAVAIEGWVVGLGRAVGECRKVAWLVGSGMC
jgi:hypothetical protein